MAVSPTHPVDSASAAAQRLANAGVLDHLMTTLFGLVDRCGWRWATIACAGAMLLLGLGVTTTLEEIFGLRHTQRNRPLRAAFCGAA